MKKILLTLSAVILAFTTNAQYFRVGLNGGYNSTWLFNKNVSDAGDELDYKSSFGGQIGIDALWNFQESTGIYLGIISNSINQKYTIRPGNGENYVAETKFKYITVPLLFRYTGEKGPYFEVGPEFSFGAKAKSKVEDDEEDIPSEAINSSNIAAVLGFGITVKASEQIHVDIGLRFAWGLSDVMKEPDGAQNYEPTNTAAGGLHLGVAYVINKK